jgi:ligand-binding SRPBCC domain-containing protein
VRGSPPGAAALLMADYVLERRCWLPRPRPQVFAFFADPRNLAELSPPGAAPRWLEPPPAVLDAGALLDFRVRVLGISTRWRVMIREYDPPYRFVDVQLRGPFARWEHRHRFLEGPERDGVAGPVGTWMEDRLTYRLPLSGLGRLAHALGAGRKIHALFDERERRLRAALG